MAMNEKHEPTTSSDLGGAPAGLGASTGADPRGPAAGVRGAQTVEDRSYAPTEPGHTSDVGEGGGAMSGRGQEQGPDQAHQARDAHEQAMRERPDGGIGGGGVAGAGTGGGGLGHDSELGAPSSGLGGDAGLGEGSSGGGQITGAMESQQRGGQAGDLHPIAGGEAATGDAADYGAAMPGPGVSGGGADETAGTGENATGGTGAAAGGDAHLGKDGEKLGDPMNAKRQIHSDDSGDIANGSGAD